MASTCEPLCQFTERLFFTTFPHPAPTAYTLNRIAADPATHPPRVRARPRGGPASTPDDLASYYWFTIDDQLLYLSFFQDWGPLNLAMVYKACILMHELLEDAELKSQRLVLYASDDPRRKANAALLMALYVMIVERRAPWEAFQPIAEVEFMPFRDAGRGPSDFNLTIQDCLWGLWKAMQSGLCDMNAFNVDDYEYYEKVENGDWNWLTPHFIAFASPVDPVWIKREREREQHPGGSESLASSTSSNHALQRKLPTPYMNCLEYFEQRNVRLVVRLNTHLYDRKTFLDRGIDHMELYFDDGTNPTDEIVRTFLDVADRVIEGGGAVAVHCKAGLGRTGTLIGAYLIWKYGFTANEAIAFMRIVRPGSVVGPQQQYLYLKQLEWAKWAAVDEMKRVQAEAAAEADKEKERAEAAVPLQAATPPSEEDDVDDPMRVDSDEGVRAVTPPPRPAGTGIATSTLLPPVTPSRHVLEATAKARAIATPGQPRKTPKRVAPREFDSDVDEEEDSLGQGQIEGRNGEDVDVDVGGAGVDEDEREEMADVLPALGVPAAGRKIRAVPQRQRGHLGATASVDRSERVTRSAVGVGANAGAVGVGANAGAGAAALRRVAGVRGAPAPAAGPPVSPVKAPAAKRTGATTTSGTGAAPGRAGNSAGPNKIPRLATTRTTAAAAKALGGAAHAAKTSTTAATAKTTAGKGPAVVRARPATAAGTAAGAAGRPVRKAAAAAAGTGAGARVGATGAGAAAGARTRSAAAAAQKPTTTKINGTTATLGTTNTTKAPPSTPSRLPTLLKRPGPGAAHANSLSDVEQQPKRLVGTPGIGSGVGVGVATPSKLSISTANIGSGGISLTTAVLAASGALKLATPTRASIGSGSAIGGGGVGVGVGSTTPGGSPDASWVANGDAVAAVMLPATGRSGERPGLRSSVRRRRSSFSNADVVA